MALLVVSHSRALAQGVAELAREMAPDVHVAVAGGSADGGTGTDLDAISAALAEALEAAPSVAVLYDLGSAQMTAEIALETVEGGERARLVDAAVVEGGIAAAVEAQGGGDLDAVATAAAAAAGAAPEDATPEERPAGAGDDVGRPSVQRTVVLTNPLGLHARPAARVAAAARRLGGARLGPPGAELVDASAVMRVVALGLRGGDEVRVTATSDAAADDLAELVGSGFGEEDDPATSAAPAGTAGTTGTTPGREGSVVVGASGSPGLAVGRLVLLAEAEPDLRSDDGAADDEALGDEALGDEALDDGDRDDGDHDGGPRERARRAGTSAAARLAERGPVAAMHAELLSDPDLLSAVEARLDAGEGVARAWWTAATQAAERLAASSDPLVAQRAPDVRDAVLAVLDELGVAVGPPSGDHLQGAVVLADDVLPSWVAPLAEQGVAGLALRRSGPTAHAAVVARGVGLPAAVGLGADVEAEAGREVVLDGTRGSLDLAPDDDALARAREQVRADEERARERRAASAEPVVVDGRRVAVAANVASAAEARRAATEGADGVGLLRTELMLDGRAQVPSEDEQVAALVAVAAELPGQRVVVRTFDVGGDKPVAGLDLDPVRHGFLGERGLRYGLAHRDLLDTQLRAVVRAAAEVSGAGTRLAVMAPMVSVVEEVHAFREAVEGAVLAAREAGHEAQAPADVGIMVEVPAAALAVETLAPHVDFVSVGTNDLVQYVMAAERTTAEVRHLYQPDGPAVRRVLELLVAGATEAGCEVAVCGQMAAEAESARWLVGLGVAELSVPPASVPEVKAALRGDGGREEPRREG